MTITEEELLEGIKEEAREIVASDNRVERMKQIEDEIEKLNKEYHELKSRDNVRFGRYPEIINKIYEAIDGEVKKIREERTE